MLSEHQGYLRQYVLIWPCNKQLTSYYQLSINHEFTAAQTKSGEEKVPSLLSFIQENKNPLLPIRRDIKLHNIITQEVVDEIRF